VPAILPGNAVDPTLGSPVGIGAAPFDVGSNVQVADVSRDGRDDVAVDSSSHAGIVSLLAAGSLGFRLTGGAYVFPSVISAWTLDDADGDGKLDLIALVGSDVDIYYGRGPELLPPAAEVDFGSVPLGSTSGPLTGRFTNAGPGTADDLLLLADGDINDFLLEDDHCSGATLDVDAGCAMTARFRPTALGDRELDVALVAPDSDEADWVALTGIGANAVSATPSPLPSPSPTANGKLSAPRLTRAGRARLLGHARLDTGWSATCPAGGPSCRVSVLIVARARPGRRAPVLVRATVAVPVGAARRLTVDLTAAGRRALLAHKTVHAVLRLSASRARARGGHRAAQPDDASLSLRVR
jgi:hypothetical protein